MLQARLQMLTGLIEMQSTQLGEIPELMLREFVFLSQLRIIELLESIHGDQPEFCAGRPAERKKR